MIVPQEDFLEGLRDSLKFSEHYLVILYLTWLRKEAYSEPARIDLEAGGYQAGLETAQAIKDTLL